MGAGCFCHNPKNSGRIEMHLSGGSSVSRQRRDVGILIAVFQILRLKMKELSEEISSAAMDSGADLVGFAPVERFAHGPEKTHPNYFMPKARSVVSIAIGFPRSIGEVWGTYKEEATLPGPYMWFGFAYLNWELSRVALKVAKHLEKRGFRSLPLPPAHTLVQYRHYEHFDQWNRYL